MWEANSGWNDYGTPMSPMLFPYWTEGTHPSMEGLFFESSITTPFHFINHSEMSVAHLRRRLDGEGDGDDRPQRDALGKQ